MTGTILGYDLQNRTGTISGDDGKRYKFIKDEWKENYPPRKEVKIDFDVNDDGVAIDIYEIRDKASDENAVILGLVSIGITFFFGFIGTFVSRLVISRQPIEQTIVPTFIHFIITVAAVIPVVGWVVYLIGTLYYMVKNYQLVSGSKQYSQSKYA